MALDTPTAPAPHNPHDSHEREKKGINPRLVAAIAAGAVGLVGGGIAVSRLLSSGEDPSADKRPVAVGPAVPGANDEVQPTPSTSESVETDAPLTPLEEQAKLFERLDLPETAIADADLRPLIDRNALDIYIGVDGGVGLYPDVQKYIDSERRAFYLLTPEDIEAELNRLDLMVTGTHLDVVDGKVVAVPNTTLMEGGEFRGAMSKDSIKETTDRLVQEKGDTPEMRSAGAASTLANAADDVIGLQLMGKMLAAEGRVAEYYVTNPDEEPQLSQTNSAGFAESAYAAHGNVNRSAVDNRIEVARKLMHGETTYDQPAFETTRIVDVYDYEIKNADGTKTMNVLGAAIVGQTQSGKSFTMTVAMIPTEKAMGVTPEGKFALMDAPEDTFHTVLIGKFVSDN